MGCCGSKDGDGSEQSTVPRMTMASTRLDTPQRSTDSLLDHGLLSHTDYELAIQLRVEVAGPSGALPATSGVASLASIRPSPH